MTDGRPNPYSPPARDGALTVGAPPSSGVVAGALGLVVLLVSGLHVFRGTLYFTALAYAELSRDFPVASALDATWAATRALSLIAAVAFAVWIYRANRDARSLGARGMVFTPGWSVATTFLPVVNLVAPFRAVREVYQASHPDPAFRRDVEGEAWKAAPVTPLLGLWWGLFLASLAWLALSQLVLEPSLAAYRQPVLELSLAASGLCFVAVVRRVHNRLEARAVSKKTLDQSPPNQDVSAA